MHAEKDVFELKPLSQAPKRSIRMLPSGTFEINNNNRNTNKTTKNHNNNNNNHIRSLMKPHQKPGPSISITPYIYHYKYPINEPIFDKGYLSPTPGPSRRRGTKLLEEATAPEQSSWNKRKAAQAAEPNNKKSKPSLEKKAAFCAVPNDEKPSDKDTEKQSNEKAPKKQSNEKAPKKKSKAKARRSSPTRRPPSPELK